MKIYMQLILIALLALQPASMLAKPSAIQQDDTTAMFLKLFDALDKDGDGVVLLTDLFDALDLQTAEARQVRRTRALDANGDGKVTRAEGIAGVNTEVSYQTNRGMNTDADGDGELTPTEFALAYADPNGKADASGLTQLQMNAFKADDLNGDGKITRNEVETRVRRNYAAYYWSNMVTCRMRSADTNQDGVIDEQEVALLQTSPAQSAEAQKGFSLTNGKMVVKTMQTTMFQLFLRLSDEDRALAEKQLDDFERKMKIARPSNQSQGVK